MLYDRIRGLKGQVVAWVLLLTTQAMTAHIAYSQDELYQAVNEANMYAEQLRSQRAAPSFDANGNLIHNGNVLFSKEELAGQKPDSYSPATTDTYGDDAATLIAGEQAQQLYEQKTLDTAVTAGERAYHITKDSFKLQKNDLSNDPLWSLTDDVYDNLEDIAADLANCEVSTALVSNGKEIHVPKYESCTRLPAIEDTFTISHDYEVGVIKYSSGPVNISPCGAGCVDVWIGTVGNNYWAGNCTIYEESMVLEVIQPNAITNATLTRSKFDDYHQVYLNNLKIYNGPNANFPPETGGKCELSKSWDLYPNVNVTSAFQNVASGGNLQFKTRTSVSGNGEGYSAIRVYYDHNQMIFNDVWNDAEKISKAYEIKQQIDDGFCTGSIQCTNMPVLDGNGCTTINGLYVCESNFANNPMANLGISPFCRSVSVKSTCGFNDGEFCTTDMDGVEHCYDNTTVNTNTCTKYEDDPLCSYVSSSCVEGAEGDSGNCYVQEDTYDCGFTVNDGQEVEENVLLCDGELACIGESCYSPKRDKANQEFAQVNAYLEVLKFASADMTCAGIPERPYDPENPPHEYVPVPVCEDGYQYDIEANACLKQTTCAYSESDFYAASERNGIQVLVNNTVLANDENIKDCQPITISNTTYTCGDAVTKLATDTFYEVCQNNIGTLSDNGCPSSLHTINQLTGTCQVAPIVTCEDSDYTPEGQNTRFLLSDDVCHAPTHTPTPYGCDAGYELNASGNHCVKQPETMPPKYECPEQYPIFSEQDFNCQSSSNPLDISGQPIKHGEKNHSIAKKAISTVLWPLEHMAKLMIPTALANSSIESYVGQNLYSAAVQVGQSSTQTPGQNVTCELFKGEAAECKVAVGGIQNCCESPVAVSLGDYISLIQKTLQFESLTAQVFGIEGYTGVWDIATDWAGDVAASAWDTVQSEFASALDIAASEGTNAATSGGSAAIGQQLMSYAHNFMLENFGPEVAGMLFQTTAGGQVAWSAQMAAVGNALMVVYYAYLAYVIFNLLVNILFECKEEEFDLAMKRELLSTHYIGSYCKSEVLGACIEKRRVYCKFDSPLSRIVMEQVYAQPQMGLNWGSPKNPNCTGIQIDELQNVNWDKVNLDEWVGILIKTGNYADAANINVDTLTGVGSNLNYDKNVIRENVIEKNIDRSENIDADEVRRDAYEDAWGVSMPTN